MSFKKTYLKSIDTHHTTEDSARKAAMIHFKSFPWWQRILFLTTEHVFEYKYFKVCNLRGNSREFRYDK
jgi:hypothetical protein